MDKVESEKEIKKIYNRYKKYFELIGQDKLSAYDDLLNNIAFMTYTLSTLQNEIKEKGVVERFEQGTQNFLRENPALKSYNTTIKNYISAVKQLNDLLPEKEDKKVGEDLIKFVMGQK